MSASAREAEPVLLINPRMCGVTSARLPLSLLHLASVLPPRHPWQILDGNLGDIVHRAVSAVRERRHALVGVTVMPGPQVATAIEVSSAIRAAVPTVPIVWGGYFPTMYPDAAINAPYVDYLVRGQGEATLVDLLEKLPPNRECDVPGLTWKRDGVTVHNPERPIVSPETLPFLPYGGLARVDPYLQPTFMGRRTAVHQAALGCRFKCDFCGVVSMWNGETVLDAPAKLARSLRTLKDEWGADSVQFFDHNFFDREETSLPILDVLEKASLPWWCYARADTMARFSSSTWERVRRSHLKMAYIGAEAASDEVLQKMRKGTRVGHTLEVAARCHENGVIPEFSFVLGGPTDPEGEIEKTFLFIRKIKELHPESEIVLYFYSPTPQVDRALRKKTPGVAHLPVLSSYGPSGPALPSTPEEWTLPKWVSWVCHQDAPWLTEKLRRRVADFAHVLACRFPTVQDHRAPRWGKAVLRNVSRIRYATRRYDNPVELKIGQRLLRLRDPRSESL